MERSKAGTKVKWSPGFLNYSLGQSSPEAVDELHKTYLTYTYNSSTATWRENIIIINIISYYYI